jgi:hypothetical protein
MTTDSFTDTITTEEGHEGVALFDSSTEDLDAEGQSTPEPNEPADLTWQDFTAKLSSFPKGKDMKVRLILAITVLAKGKADQLVDFDAVASHIGRQKGSLASYLPELVADGWLTREAGVSSENRPVFVHRTARSVRG